MTDALGGGTTPVSALTESSVVRVAPDATLAETAAVLWAASVGAVVVGSDDRPLGIVSERDVVRVIAEGKEVTATRAIDVANVDLVWCDASATIAEVAAEMMERYVRHILVEDGGELVGIVSVRDLLGAYAAADTTLDRG
jgi:CBS domain-containing protein